LETRAFEDDNKGTTKDNNLSLFTRLKVRTKHHKKWGETIRVIARADKYDPSRSVFIIEEAYTKYSSGNFEFSAGSQMFNWSATEAFHPADVINSRNFDSNLENAEKIGEPMLLGTYIGEESKYSVFFMPMLTKPILPQYTNRLNLSAGLPMAEPEFIDKSGKVIEGEYANQFGVRFEHSFDDADISLHYINHYDRTTPIAIPVLVGVTPTGILPLYLPVQQVGGSLQMVSGSWLIKSELAQRMFSKITSPTLGVLEIPNHLMFAFGLEYGWSTKSGSESTWVLEGQSLFGPDEDERAQISIFQRDLLLGYRYAFNDVRGQELFASIIYDIERSSEMLLNINYQRRLSSRWKLKAGYRMIDAKQKKALPVGLELIDGANQFYFDLTRYF
ncbi:MAG: hypothetical protein KDD58_04700, partial [Bdellovibrionales bacterium]|nr:hypothetical protein [Bdellovibrionales bacterium]